MQKCFIGEMKWVIWSSTIPPCGRARAVERGLDWDRRSSIHGIVAEKGRKGNWESHDHVGFCLLPL